MKVSIFGTHYTGKTTLAKILAQKTNLIYNQTDQSIEIAKSMNINSLDKLENMDINYKWLFQIKMLESLKKTINNSIADGNSISCIPYGKKLLKESFINSETGKAIINEAIENSNNYDYLFYLPPEFDFKIDSFRHNGDNFRMLVAKELLDNIKGNYKVLTGSVEDRIKTAKYVMKFCDKPARYNHIVFEGICNSGKSTIMKMVLEKLDEEKTNYFFAERKSSPNNNTKESDLILWYDNLNKYKENLLKSYIDLFTYTNEYNNIEDKIKNGDIVFSDRYKFSIIALGLGLGYDLNYMYKITNHLKTPGTIIFFDLPFSEGVKRAKLNNKSMPTIRQNENLQKIMSEGFKKLASIHAEVKIINANQEKQKLFDDVYNIIREIIK